MSACPPHMGQPQAALRAAYVTAVASDVYDYGQREWQAPIVVDMVERLEMEYANDDLVETTWEWADAVKEHHSDELIGAPPRRRTSKTSASPKAKRKPSPDKAPLKKKMKDGQRQNTKSENFGQKRKQRRQMSVYARPGLNRGNRSHFTSALRAQPRRHLPSSALRVPHHRYLPRLHRPPNMEMRLRRCPAAKQM